MIRALSKALVTAALAAATLLWNAVPAGADLVPDPQLVYQAMKAQFDTGTQRGWKFGDWLDYFSTVIDAGRAYALRRPNDANAYVVAGVAVDLAVKLRYNPLANRDAAEWYVRDAAAKMIATGDPARAAAARALVERLDQIEQTTSALGRAADADAAGNLNDFPSDPLARMMQVDANWKAWMLTRDTSYRQLALQRAAGDGFPLANLSDPTATGLFAAARGASDRGLGYSPQEIEAGKIVTERRAQIHDPLVIAHVATVPKERLMRIRAPADEYFGRMHMSVFGIRNEIDRINKYLDVGWGDRMANDGDLLADAIESWHHEYPHDTALPDVLLRGYRVLVRIDAEPATSAAQRIRRLLIVEYINTDQARELLAT